MTAVALVVAHNLIFLLAYGSAADEALARTGHGEEWQTAVEVVLGAGASLLAVAIWRLRALGIVARRLGADRAGPVPLAAGFGHALGSLWLRVTAAATVMFVVQENIEHLGAGHGLPGIEVLASSEYPTAALVIAAVALVVAFVGALVRWRRAELIARIAAAIRGLRRPITRSIRRPALDAHRWPGSILGRRLAVRAPPAPASTWTAARP